MSIIVYSKPSCVYCDKAKSLLTRLGYEYEEKVVTKDLSFYQIVIDEDFFVAIEWIEDLGPGNLFFSGGFLGSPLIAREVSQGTWSKVGAASVGMNLEVRF